MDGTLEVSERIRIPLREIDITYARSSGPGGQNVNKTDSKAVLRFDLAGSESIPESMRAQALRRLGSRLTRTGELVLSSDRHREQSRNREDVLARLVELLADATRPRKPRKRTKPTAAARRARVESKRIRGTRKQQRRSVPAADDAT